MASLEFSIGHQKYVLKSEEDEDHLREITELVKRKVENLKKSHPTLLPHKALMLIAVDLASQVIKGKKKAMEQQSTLLNRTTALLKKIETISQEASH